MSGSIAQHMAMCDNRTRIVLVYFYYTVVRAWYGVATPYNVWGKSGSDFQLFWTHRGGRRFRVRLGKLWLGWLSSSGDFHLPGHNREFIFNCSTWKHIIRDFCDIVMLTWEDVGCYSSNALMPHYSHMVAEISPVTWSIVIAKDKFIS